jgi:hypothetical protein
MLALTIWFRQSSEEAKKNGSEKKSMHVCRDSSLGEQSLIKATCGEGCFANFLDKNFFKKAKCRSRHNSVLKMVKMVKTFFDVDRDRWTAASQFRCSSSSVTVWSGRAGKEAYRTSAASLSCGGVEDRICQQPGNFRERRHSFMASILHSDIQSDVLSPVKDQVLKGSPALELRKQLSVSSPSENGSRRLSEGDSFLSSANTPTMKSLGDSFQSSPHGDQGSDVNPEPKEDQSSSSSDKVDASPRVKSGVLNGLFSFGRKDSPAKPKKMNGYVSHGHSFSMVLL